MQPPLAVTLGSKLALPTTTVAHAQRLATRRATTRTYSSLRQRLQSRPSATDSTDDALA